ncbi:MAG: MmcQ/YjbR family DNA-binding protein [Myxococcaceae bacterium]|nr:MmcQ/YjbR family DNA-binding protein [Myxococcaceae bacterium]MCI0671226.1 MmcQ/YjbR family DNA-binding protein [Myxococcaceae bacterium]
MTTLKAAEKALMDAALAYPQTREDNPWGHRVAKVKDKSFLFLATENGVLSLSVKLPHSGGMALSLPFAEPTGYGMGKSGWVTASFKPGQPVPVELLRAWLDESYQAVAPKTLVKALQAERAGSAAPLPHAKSPAPKAAKKAAKRVTTKRAAKAETRAVSAGSKRASSRAASARTRRS